MSDHTAGKNTNHILWCTNMDDRGYADILFLTDGGGIGMNVGGRVIVKPMREWHRLAMAANSEMEVMPYAADGEEAAVSEKTK